MQIRVLQEIDTQYSSGNIRKNERPVLQEIDTQYSSGNIRKNERPWMPSLPSQVDREWSCSKSWSGSAIRSA
ncbi:unnamed protein product [Echinostoma caproni]|uniref:Transposase n=1 Tax=Echinostoma caproni TaxID=27848 RepID=A0A183BEP3_9TREM|nr:unnamed protein product [Echinostoma caproni]